MRKPSFWWDFAGVGEIIVECDDNRYPVVGRFWYDVSDTTGQSGQEAIERANRLISDLTAGRVNLKDAAKNV